MARPTPRILLRRKLLCVAIAAGFPMAVNANPTGAHVTSGSADFTTTGGMLTISNSPGAIIEYASFSIGLGEHTHFQQLSAESQVLNRVVGGNPSLILGALTSNGRVFLINPNGIAFGPGSTVDVAGLVASTLNLSNADFLAGRLSFSGQPGAGSIRNDGTLQAASGGRIYLVAPTIENHGVIAAPDGSVVLAAGHSVILIDSKRPDVQVKLTAGADQAVNVGRIVSGYIGIYGATIRQGGSISATMAVAGENGSVILKAAGNVITDPGSSIVAGGTGGGSVEISADFFSHAGSINTDGGIIRIAAGGVFQSGAIRADGAVGGEITVRSSGNVWQTAASILSANGIVRGGDISIDAGAGQLYSAGRFEAMASGGTGGRITLTGDRIALVAASADSGGTTGGGAIRIGGDFHGADAGAPNSQSVYVSDAVSLRSDATVRGDGGTVVAWSDGSTRFSGSISVRGGANGGNGGMAEVSGAGDLRYSGNTDATAARGATGSLLLDPKNIIIDDSAPSGGSGYIVGDFIDPNPTAGGNFGSSFNTSLLFNGNLLVRVPDATVGSFANAGATYLFNGITRGLIGALTGGKANDRVGANGTFFLNNGNYIVRSEDWNDGRGALTFGRPDSLVSGVVGAANSLVGATAGDHIGSGGIVQLGSGDNGPFGSGTIGIGSQQWTNPETTAANAGAFTIFTTDGSLLTAGLTGVVSALNSLVGTHAGDRVGDALSVNLSNSVNLFNGEVSARVLITPKWNAERGAATLIFADNPAVGAVDANLSLIGSTAGDGVNMRVEILQGGDVAVVWPKWSNSAREATGAGAISFGIGEGGVVSASNSLVGNAPGSMNEARIVTLAGNFGHNYLVANPGWSDVAAQQTANGAVTFVARSTGIAGEVTAANSLIGGSGNQRIGDDVRVRDDGNYLVVAPNWTNEVNGVANAGAVTFGKGATGVVGVVSAANSFVGISAGDRIGSGGIYNVAAGNFVIASPEVSNGRGLVVWANGATGVTGTPNSIVPGLRGSTPGDRVGSFVTVLSNGNYVVHSSEWSFDDDDGDGTGTGTVAVLDQAGAMTWVAGATGFIAGASNNIGVVSRANSLTGAASGARFGSGGVQQLSNGNYLVLSPDWTDDASNPEKGAVTYLLGDSGNVPNGGSAGIASASNSLVGKFANDRIGTDIAGGLAVSQTFGGTNGGIVVRSPRWNSETGAVTWMSALDGSLPGQTTIGGVVDVGNSIVGTAVLDRAGDRVGEEFRDLFNGFYLIGSPHWSDAARDIQGVGAVTLFRSGTGERVADNATFGTLSSGNSFVGNATDEAIGHVQNDIHQVFVGGGSRFLLYSPDFNGGNSALTWLGDGTTAVTGIIGATNSLVGAGLSDNINTVNDTIVVSSPGLNDGRGAVTFIAADGAIFGTGGKTFGTIGATNSLVGQQPGDGIAYQGSFFANPGGNVAVVGSASWNGNRGAISFVDAAGGAGVIGPDNSLVGANGGDRVGSGGFTTYGAGNDQRHVVLSPDWNGARGAMTYYNKGTLNGAFAAITSLVGSTANDRVGSNGIQSVGFNGASVLNSPNWNSNAGAVSYLGDGDTSVTGAVSAANSIVGAKAGQQVGRDGVFTLSPNAYLVLSSRWTDNASANLGAITWVDATTGRPLDGNGVVSRANSLVGPVAGALYGERSSSTGTDVHALFNGNKFYLYAPTGPSASAAVNGGRLMLVDVSATGSASPGSLSFGNQSGGDVTIRGTAIASALATANLVLEASNDITLVAGTNITVAGTRGHSLTLRAGRGVLLNGSITTANGDLTVIANEQIHTGSAPTGVVAANRDAGRADIVMAAGTSIDAGSGDVRLEIRDGRVDVDGTQFNTGGDIRVADIRGATITMLNRSAPDAAVGSVFLAPAVAITTTGSNGLISIQAPNIISVGGLVKAPNGRIELRAGALGFGRIELGAGALGFGSSFADGGIAYEAKDIVIAPDGTGATAIQVGGIPADAAIGLLFVSQDALDGFKATGTLQIGDALTRDVFLGLRSVSAPGGLRLGPGSGGAESVTGLVKVTGNATSSIFVGGPLTSRVAGLTFERPVTVGGDMDLGPGTVLFDRQVSVAGSRSIGSSAPFNAVTFKNNLEVALGNSLALSGPMSIASLLVTGGNVSVNGATSATTVDLSRGSIRVPGTLRVGDFIQSGGSLVSGGTEAKRGDFIVTNSYRAASGELGRNWASIAITHRTGNLRLDRLMDVGTSLAVNTTAGRLVVASRLFSEGTIALAASGGIAIEANVLAENNLSISTPRDLTVALARVTSSFGNISLNVGSLELLAFRSGEQGATEIMANRGRLDANVAGNARIVGGNFSGTFEGTFARIGSRSGECAMTIGGDLILTGGDGNRADASVVGSPDVGSVARPLSVGGQVILTSGAGEGGFARIDASQPDTIHLRFPTRTSGGYLVNGKAVVADGGSGFFAGNQVAVLDRNLLISYGQNDVLFDPTPALSPIVTAGERGGQFLFPRERRREDDPSLPSCR